ncbi:keratin-associated protein 13-1-like [Nannospalax galili]|uniref:keratin-associated protein 13-1-like n=1 Tax=Nannospalax galili TaxID=1026970 RepID=UPI00111BFEFA|nr:keratin-associated protein 13-1-like [Nannospalax galili]
MADNWCPGNFSFPSTTLYLPCSGSSYGSSYPSNRVYSTISCRPSTCLLDSSLHWSSQSRCSNSVDYGSSGFRVLNYGVSSVPSLNYGTRIC